MAVQEEVEGAGRPAVLAQPKWGWVLPDGLAHMAGLQDHLALALPDGSISLIHASSGAYLRCAAMTIVPFPSICTVCSIRQCPNLLPAAVASPPWMPISFSFPSNGGDVGRKQDMPHLLRQFDSSNLVISCRLLMLDAQSKSFRAGCKSHSLIMPCLCMLHHRLQCHAQSKGGFCCYGSVLSF